MDHRHTGEGHQVKKVVLPSGKTIEVVSFADGGYEPLPANAVTVDPGVDLHVCRECDSKLAYPVAWEEAGEQSWLVEIRCPECETRREGVFAQEAVEDFDEVLDAGADALIGDYRRLVRTNMAEEVERFARALEVGAIVPEDF